MGTTGTRLTNRDLDWLNNNSHKDGRDKDMKKINEYCSDPTCDGYTYYGSGCSVRCECQEARKKGIKYADKQR